MQAAHVRSACPQRMRSNTVAPQHAHPPDCSPSDLSSSLPCNPRAGNRSYSLGSFYEDVINAFPELALYMCRR